LKDLLHDFLQSSYHFLLTKQLLNRSQIVGTYDKIWVNINFHCILTGPEAEDVTFCFRIRLPLLLFLDHILLVFTWDNRPEQEGKYKQAIPTNIYLVN